MIQTCLASMEYVNSAKRGGIYSYLLHYISSVQSGANPPLLPGEQNLSHSMKATQAIPRSMQPIPSHAGPGATHPSMLHAPSAANYQQPQMHYQGQYQGQHQGQQQLSKHVDNTPSWKIVTDTPKQKAISYFASCLEVLGIQEEVALTEEALKSAYKRTALRAHPDKGGSEEYFEAVTRSYAYLSGNFEVYERRA